LERRWAGGRGGQGLVATSSGQSKELEAGRARRRCWAVGKRRRKGEKEVGLGLEYKRKRNFPFMNLGI
jgi:hypothetical protein